MILRSVKLCSFAISLGWCHFNAAAPVIALQDEKPIIAEADIKTVSVAEALFAEGKLLEAIQYLKALEQESEKPGDHLKIAEMYNALQDGIAAEVAVDRAIELGADLNAARVYKARSLLIQRKFQTALALFRALDIPEALYETGQQTKGEAFFGAGDYEAASNTFRSVLENDPNNLEALKGLAHVALQTGNLSSAKKIAERARDLNPEDTLVYYILGSVSRIKNDNNNARTLLNQSVALFPQNILSLLELAAIEVAEQQFEEADILLDKVYELYPEHPQAVYLSAQIQALKGDYVEAEILLIKLAQYADIYPPVNHLYGIVAYRLENYSTAIANLQSFLRSVPSHRETRLVLADSLKKRELFREALDVLAPLVSKENTQDFDALMLAATVASSAGKADDGLKYLLKASKVTEKEDKEKDDQLIKRKLAYSNYLAGNFETAESLIKQIQNESAHDVASLEWRQDLMVLANIQLKKGDYLTALKTSQTLAQAMPKSYEAYNLMASAHSYLGQNARAIEFYTKAVELNNTYTTARRNRALLYLKEKDLNATTADLYAVLKLEPEDTRSRAMLGRVELLNENYNQAINNLEIAIAAFPGSLDVSLDYVEALYKAGYASKALNEIQKIQEEQVQSAKPVLLKRYQTLRKQVTQ
jgi:tetratricopeptide (TPR) repeat protein